MAVQTSPHTHPESWPDTMDWVELRVHVITVHYQQPGEIDHLDGELDGIAERRKRLETLHQTLHASP
jgi:hypothetical protein